MMPVTVSEPPSTSHGRNRHAIAGESARRRPAGSAAARPASPWSSVSVTGPRAPAAPNSDHGLLPHAPRISAPGAQTSAADARARRRTPSPSRPSNSAGRGRSVARAARSPRPRPPGARARAQSRAGIVQHHRRLAHGDAEVRAAILDGDGRRARLLGRHQTGEQAAHRRRRRGTRPTTFQGQPVGGRRVGDARHRRRAGRGSAATADDGPPRHIAWSRK